MPQPAFHLKLSADTRYEFDEEIRNRGYGDCVGLVGWLKERGVDTNKTSIHKYEQRLRKSDDVVLVSAHRIPPEASRAIFEFGVHCMKAFSAFQRAMAAIRDERTTKPD